MTFIPWFAGVFVGAMVFGLCVVLKSRPWVSWVAGIGLGVLIWIVLVVAMAPPVLDEKGSDFGEGEYTHDIDELGEVERFHRPPVFSNFQEVLDEFSDVPKVEALTTYETQTASGLAVTFVSGFFPDVSPAVVELEMQRLALFAIYRGFLHTKLQSITVTVKRGEWADLEAAQSDLVTLIPYEVIHVSTTRAQALEALQSLNANIQGWDDLLQTKMTGNIPIYDEWSDAFEPFYWRVGRQKKLLTALGATWGSEP